MSLEQAKSEIAKLIYSHGNNGNIYWIDFACGIKDIKLTKTAYSQVIKEGLYTRVFHCSKENKLMIRGKSYV